MFRLLFRTELRSEVLWPSPAPTGNISLEADEAPCIRDDNCKAGFRCSDGQCVAAAKKKPGAEERRQRSLQAAV